MYFKISNFVMVGKSAIQGNGVSFELGNNQQLVTRTLNYGTNLYGYNKLIENKHEKEDSTIKTCQLYR